VVSTKSEKTGRREDGKTSKIKSEKTGRREDEKTSKTAG
jgi:hypothetical protein